MPTDVTSAVSCQKWRCFYPEAYGLAAIVGPPEKRVSTLVEELFTEQNPMYVGNINAPRQIVIAGSNEGMDAVLDAAQKSGARKAVRPLV